MTKDARPEDDFGSSTRRSSRYPRSVAIRHDVLADLWQGHPYVFPTGYQPRASAREYVLRDECDNRAWRVSNAFLLQRARPIEVPDPEIFSPWFHSGRQAVRPSLENTGRPDSGNSTV